MPGMYWARGTASIVFVVLLALLAAAGCGSSESATQDRIEAERQEAAQAARQDERLKNLQREFRELQREAARGASQGDGSSLARAPASGVGSSVPGGRACGGGVIAGPNTSCPFALNVESAYRQSGDSTVIDVYSPVTELTYTMRCVAGSPVVCTGGNDASVYIP